MKTKTQETHTPGPWKDCLNGDVIGGHGLNEVIVRARYSEPIAISQANARLIAAAPELLTACKNALLWINDGNKFRAIQVLETAVSIVESRELK